MTVLIAAAMIIISCIIIVKMCFYVENRITFTTKQYIILGVLLCVVSTALCTGFMLIAVKFL